MSVGLAMTVFTVGVLLRDASVLTTLFWIGLALLAIYHILWVV